MDNKWKILLHELIANNVEFVIANLDKVNFGNRDIVVKLALRLTLRKIQAALRSKDFWGQFRELLSNFATLVK